MSEQPQFKVGDVVWYAQCGIVPVRKTCPVCFGRLHVTIILGDDSLVDVPCSYCAPGYERPKGYEVVHEYAAKAYSDWIKSVQVTTSDDGEHREYRLGDGRAPERVFATEAEAMVVAEEMRRKNDEDNEQRRKHGKEQAERSFSWHVGYHGREIKDARRRLEYHESRVQPCKDAARIERAQKRAKPSTKEGT